MVGAASGGMLEVELGQLAQAQGGSKAEEDISDFQKASGNANDPDIKAFASNHLAMLRMHLDSAQAIQQRVKKM